MGIMLLGFGITGEEHLIRFRAYEVNIGKNKNFSSQESNKISIITDVC